jgi:hypothetical protein
VDDLAVVSGELGVSIGPPKLNSSLAHRKIVQGHF